MNNNDAKTKIVNFNSGISGKVGKGVCELFGEMILVESEVGFGLEGAEVVGERVSTGMGLVVGEVRMGIEVGVG